LTPYDTRDAGEIERAFAAIARGGIGGVIVTAGSTTAINRDLITGLVARHRLPAIYSARYFVTAGGMISYGSDTTDSFRRAAGYVDRILRGERPADMPVQAPSKNELVINMRTAKALGLTIPETLLATADEVIQ
jgi:putative ABC transport system substrate-binding protein